MVMTTAMAAVAEAMRALAPQENGSTVAPYDLAMASPAALVRSYAFFMASQAA